MHFNKWPRANVGMVILINNLSDNNNRLRKMMKGMMQKTRKTTSEIGDCLKRD